MTELNDARSVDELIARYQGFFDSLLMEVTLRFSREREKREARVRLLAQAKDERWHSVVFVVKGQGGFAFSEGRTSHLVLSNGLGIYLLDGEMALDLAPVSSDVRDEETLRESPQYVRGRTCLVETTELRDDEFKAGA